MLSRERPSNAKNLLLHGNRRRRRRWRLRRRFSLRFLLLLVVVVCVLCMVSPTIYDHARVRFRLVLLPIRMREEARDHLQRFRPPAARYRNERLFSEEYGFTLQGDCMINGQWHRYWVYGTIPANDPSTRTRVVPLSE
jgi:hypothetical protein